MKGARNVAIVLAIAAVAYVVPGGGAARDGVSTLLSIAFLGTAAWLGAWVYRRNKLALETLSDRMRALLYGSLAVATLALTGTHVLWRTGGGTLAWFVLLVAAAAGLYTVFRASREY